VNRPTEDARNKSKGADADIEGVETSLQPGGDTPVSPVLISRSALATNRLFRNSHECGDQFVRLREAARRAGPGG